MNNPRPSSPTSPIPRPPGRRARLLYTGTFMLAMGVLFPASPVLADAPAVVRSTVRSGDLHYLVSGLSPADNLRWLDRLSTREKAFCKWVGRAVPFGSDPPVAISFRSRAEGIEPVVRIQGWEDGRFLQRLAATGVWGVEAEDFDEAVCWLLLNRLAAESAPPDLRFGMGAETPDWIACGLARNLDPALRARNREWIVRDWREGRAMPLAEVVKLSRLPSGQWREKAYAAAAVEFLLPSGAADVWQTVFSAIGRRETLNARWLRAHIPALAGKAVSPESEWRAWLARTAASGSTAGQDRSLAQEALLMDLLTVRPRDWSPDVPGEVPPEVFARELAAWRGQEWCTRLAGQLLVRVQELVPGAPESLRGALAAYASYFAQLGTPPARKKHWWERDDASTPAAAPRPPDDGAWSLALNQLWQRAESLHRDFLETTLARRQYIDAWETRFRAGTSDFPGVSPDSADAADSRTPIQRYLDRIDAGQGE